MTGSRRAIVAATLALLRRAAHRHGAGPDAAPPWPGPSVDLGPIDWHGFVAFTSAHFVLPAMAVPLADAAGAGAPVPASLLEFVADLASTNAARNVHLAAELERIAHRLAGIGITPVALKGAAFLVEARASGPCADWRFMRDLDLLVPADRLAAAVAAVEGLGYRPVQRDHDPAVEAHYPPLVSACGTVLLELHTRLFGLGAFGIDPVRLRREAHPAGLSAGILLPRRADRIRHVLAHAQLHNRNHVQERLVLKDVLDLAVLRRTGCQDGEDTRAAAACQVFEQREQRVAAEDLLQAADVCLAPSPPDLSAPGASRWVARAVDRLAWPAWRQRLELPRDFARLEWHRLRHEHGHLRRRLALIRSPDRLLRSGAAWGFKQRQRLWS